jgi:hypothetical protein
MERANVIPEVWDEWRGVVAVLQRMLASSGCDGEVEESKVCQGSAAAALIPRSIS